MACHRCDNNDGDITVHVVAGRLDLICGCGNRQQKPNPLAGLLTDPEKEVLLSADALASGQAASLPADDLACAGLIRLGFLNHIIWNGQMVLAITDAGREAAARLRGDHIIVDKNRD